MRNYTAVMVVAVLVAVVGAACGGGGGGGDSCTGCSTRSISCLFTGETCDTVTGNMNDAQQAAIQTSCTNAGGSFSASACVLTGMLAGHCRYATAAMAAYTGVNIAGAVMDEHYDALAWTSLDAQTFCTTPPAGTWVP
jgi:hypothetical protein